MAVPKIFATMMVLSAGAALLPAACGKKKDADTTTGSNSSLNVSLSLQRVEAKNATALDMRALGLTEPVTNDVTISSLKFPIASIQISDKARFTNTTGTGNNTFNAYVCAGPTNDDCLVELTGAALSNLLKNATPMVAKVGTFTQVIVNSCLAQGQSASLKITATTRIKMTATDTVGTLYYTNTTTGLSTTGPAQEVAIPVSCNGSGAGYFLPKDLVIGSGQFQSQDPTPTGTATAAATATPAPILTDTIPLKLYFDIANVASASGGTTNSGAINLPNSCFGVDAQHPLICTNFPDVVGTVDTATPTVKRYLIQDTGTSPIFSPSIFGLYFGSDTTLPFGMYSRPYYSGGDRPTTETLIGAAFGPPTKNADGTVKLTTLSNWMTINSFQLTTHNGSMILDKKDDIAANPTSKLNGTETYSATLLP